MVRSQWPRRGTAGANHDGPAATTAGAIVHDCSGQRFPAAEADYVQCG